MTTLTWSNLHCAGECHLARAPYQAQRRMQLHDHDFAECCWVESGSIRHDMPHGSEVLAAGMGLCLRPEHRHGFRATAEGGVLVNIAFPAMALAELRARYPELSALWFAAQQPQRFTLDRATLARCTARVMAMPAAPSALQRDLLLLDVCNGLQTEAVRAWVEYPHWLRSALQRWVADEQALSNGMPALVALTGRSREHCSRTIKHVSNKRAVDVLNDIRLEFVARELARSHASAQSLAERFGFMNKTYFYKLFRNKYACTPAQYRRYSQASVAL